MQLELPRAHLEKYTNNAQRARVATESWGASNLYCVGCDSDALRASPANTAAIDYVCPDCAASFQLKAQSHSFGSKIVDAAYAAMLRKIRDDETPNLIALHYEPEEWRVRNAFLVPRFAFSISAIEKRRPLSPRARRAGWVGCNILLTEIPPDTRIPLIVDGRPANPKLAREQYARVRPLEKILPEKRGWTLDVLNLLRSMAIGRNAGSSLACPQRSRRAAGHSSIHSLLHFTLAEAYTLAPHLAALHPANRHVREKIRQQLQILRDLGLVRFLGHGKYQLQ